jgi:hypothetical protein
MGVGFHAQGKVAVKGCNIYNGTRRSTKYRIRLRWAKSIGSVENKIDGVVIEEFWDIRVKLSPVTCHEGP